MAADRSFRVFAPLAFFEKADAAPGQQKRIAGVVSTETKDKQDEVVLQRGLDFAPFMRSGWFNDNHSKKTTDVLGYPDYVRKFQKGDRLPDGAQADSNCTWAEGYLLDTPDARKVWELGKALQKSPRRLGFSIEGKVKKRTGSDGKTVAQAEVHNVAVTNCPVGEGTRLEALAKSLRNTEEGVEDPELDKALAAGTATPGVSIATQGPQTGEGAGKVLMPQHLEEDEKDLADPKKGTASKSLVRALVQTRYQTDRETAERATSLLFTMRQRGLLGDTTMTEKNTQQPGLTGAELEKGLRVLEQAAATPQNPRAAELFRKAQAGSLTGEERDELVKSLAQDNLASRVTSSLRDNDQIRKSIDVSDYLREQHRSLLGSLATLADHLEKSESRDHEFRVALAQTLVQMGAQVQAQGELIKGLQQAVQTFGAQPARAPKSAQAVAQVKPLAKSFAGASGGDQLTKSQIEDTMTAMIEKGMATVGGEKLLEAASKYEVLGMISPPVLDAVKEFLSTNNNQAA